MSNDILVEVVGLVGATFTTLAFVPQVVKIWKNRSSNGVSLSMYVCMLVGIIIWLAYGILINSIAVIAANILSGILQVVIIFLTLKNRKND
ncbi:SemiSWEET transporter [Flavobacteriaceae bacterium]|jgi:MtN3 and saliva related transmembrane protein|nr:SemiSWEET transporter [Flavobacteriaceae bacterium]|tara:strand:+ start:6635 stop:6907 length:273 start_codon:yes stop_codon:yes gene_type:complete